MASPRVSVAVPLFNEERCLPELLQRIRAVLDTTPGGPHEVVFVDDGSADRTPEMLEAAAAQDPRIVVVSLSRNFGHQAALSAALDHVTGDVVVLMDGDLQDPPEMIPQFIEEYGKGFDVVYAQRAKRKEGWFLRSAYALFYRLVAAVADIRLPLDAGDFALLSRRVVAELRQLPEHHRYLRGLRAWIGFRQVGIVVERSRRYSGESKYGLRGLVRLAFDGLFAFSTAPLRLAAILGLFVVAASMFYAGFALYARVFHGHPPQGFTALIVAITFLSGVQLLFLGIIGEYLGRVYEEGKRRPHYVVGKLIRRALE